MYYTHIPQNICIDTQLTFSETKIFHKIKTRSHKNKIFTEKSILENFLKK